MGRTRSQGRLVQVLRHPGVLAALGPYLLARLPGSMLLLAVLLLTQSRTGSAAAAGTASALLGVGVAVNAPLLGRLVDRVGQTRVLVTTAVVHTSCLVAYVIGGAQHPVLRGLSLLAAGASLPPVAACMRALWPDLVPDEELREAGFALESVLVEISELAGPLTVATALLLGNPKAAVLVAAASNAAGALLFAATRASRRRRSSTAAGPLLGPLSVPGVRVVLAVVVLSTASLGAVEVALAGVATDAGRPAATGVLVAVWYAGSLLGGLVWGSRSWPGSQPAQLVTLLGLVATGTALPLLAENLVDLGLLLTLGGVAIAPAVAVQLSFMARVAPPEAITESFTWGGTANFLGLGLGTVVAGAVIEASSARAGLGVAVALAAAAALVASLGAVRLDRRDATPQQRTTSTPAAAHEPLAGATGALPACHQDGNDEVEPEGLDDRTGWDAAWPDLRVSLVGYRLRDVNIAVAGLLAELDVALEERDLAVAARDEARREAAHAEAALAAVTGAAHVRTLLPDLQQSVDRAGQMVTQVSDLRGELDELAQRLAAVPGVGQQAPRLAPVPSDVPGQRSPAARRRARARAGAAVE